MGKYNSVQLKSENTNRTNTNQKTQIGNILIGSTTRAKTTLQDTKWKRQLGKHKSGIHNWKNESDNINRKIKVGELKTG